VLQIGPTVKLEILAGLAPLPKPEGLTAKNRYEALKDVYSLGMKIRRSCVNFNNKMIECDLNNHRHRIIGDD